MLRKKLKLSETPPANSEDEIEAPEGDGDMTSRHFAAPFWKVFFNIEHALNTELKKLTFESRVTFIYNPIEYACDLHCLYLKKFLSGPKALMFVGMNPGPNGMAQTGVPFGNIQTVRDWMELEGEVAQPPQVHPKRPVTGLNCRIEEPSGVRFWGVLREISTDLNIFSQQCFIHNFCPLAFFDNPGRNVTPSELKGNSKKELRDVCLKYLDQKVQLVEPKVVVAVGSYVGDCLKQMSRQSNYINSSIKFLQLPHPSPRSINNNNWPEKAKAFFESNDLIKYIKNEA